MVDTRRTGNSIPGILLLTTLGAFAFGVPLYEWGAFRILEKGAGDVGSIMLAIVGIY